MGGGQCPRGWDNVLGGRQCPRRGAMSLGEGGGGCPGGGDVRGGGGPRGKCPGGGGGGGMSSGKCPDTEMMYKSKKKEHFYMLVNYRFFRPTLK